VKFGGKVTRPLNDSPISSMNVNGHLALSIVGEEFGHPADSDRSLERISAGW
jgi:hypothetical protein